jgi:hypothetical protein
MEATTGTTTPARRRRRRRGFAVGAPSRSGSGFWLAGSGPEQKLWLLCLIVAAAILLLLGRCTAASSPASTARHPREERGDGGGGGGGGDRRERQQRQQRQQPRYSLLGVSGTLEDGFPLRPSLDYRGTSGTGNGNSSTEDFVPALRIGRALVRGYKAYLDVKDPGWRDYVEGGGEDGCGAAEGGSGGGGGGGGGRCRSGGAARVPPAIPNAVVMATGCREHANLYWVYAVDARQVLSVLAGEPRFLAIAPDAGLVDLRSEETDDRIRRIAARAAAARSSRGGRRAAGSDRAAATTEAEAATAGDGAEADAFAAIPLVTGVWFHPSYVESPPYKVMEDGTKVTSYAESLALWAGVEDHQHLRRGASGGEDVGGAQEKGGGASVADKAAAAAAALAASEAAWNRVFEATRLAEAEAARRRLPEQDEHTAPFPASAHRPAEVECRERVRMGSGSAHVRLNVPLMAGDLA